MGFQEYSNTVQIGQDVEITCIARYITWEEISIVAERNGTNITILTQKKTGSVQTVLSNRFSGNLNETGNIVTLVTTIQGVACEDKAPYMCNVKAQDGSVISAVSAFTLSVQCKLLVA